MNDSVLSMATAVMVVGAVNWGVTAMRKKEPIPDLIQLLLNKVKPPPEPVEGETPPKPLAGKVQTFVYGAVSLAALVHIGDALKDMADKKKSSA